MLHGCGNVAYDDSRIRTTTHNPYIALTWTALERLAYVKSFQLEILRLVPDDFGDAIVARSLGQSTRMGSTV